ncbi:unnamed protein product [Mesocestoides corti]|uniref:EGF-like domain-containing protein n=1 Tax=Mesocestoides corti TaxID=53468 RepID=A0A158QSL3_MESCO|nr:unnamed protein product [Mesocestoides corti]
MVRYLFPNLPYLNEFERITLEITALDTDRFTSHDLIAKFDSYQINIPTPNTSMDAGLVNVDSTEHNGQVNITAILTLECSKGYYGESCSIECFPEKYPSMLGCHDNGTSICLPGAQCYAGYNPCVPSPCQNQGQCVRTGENHDTFTCNCPLQWTGRLCDERRSPCEVASQKLASADLKDLFGLHKNSNTSDIGADTIKKPINVCKNGGICVDLMEEFKFVCNCTSGWKGELCTIPDWTNVIALGSVACGLLMILLCAVIPCCLRIRARKKRKSQPTVEPLVYRHGSAKYPAMESIPFHNIFYNSILGNSSVDTHAADNTQQYYEYCTVTTPSNKEESTFFSTSGEYEISNEERPPPELPDRPQSLAPLPKPSQAQEPLAEIPLPQVHDSVSLAPFESACSYQPLLTPRNSTFMPSPSEEYAKSKSDALPTRAIGSGESTLTKWLYASKK